VTQIADQDPANPRPYGAQQPRSRTPLIIAAALYFIWLGFLLLMAIRFPARG
jgi:hypothetical protein